MLKFENYIFDLDGTLTDPGVGIKNSIRYALCRVGLPIPDEKVLDDFIGPPLLSSFEKYFDVTPSEGMHLISLFREYFAAKGYLENSIFADTKSTLHAIKEQGGRIFLATGKPEHFAVKILKHFGIYEYFDFCAGCDEAETRSSKVAVLEYLLKNTKIDPARSLMVGDRCYDIDGAHAFSMSAAAVTFGYGGEQELSSAEYLLPSLYSLLTL